MSSNPSQPNAETTTSDKKSKDTCHYVLITQCLQNGFFLDAESRLALPVEEAERLLGDLSEESQEEDEKQAPVRTLAPNATDESPLYQFLKALVQDLKEAKKLGENEEPDLHVINIKDWHEQNQGYDQERELYGVHCQANTWAAETLDCLKPFLEPGPAKTPEAASDPNLCYVRGKVKFYEIRSNSLFDFRPQPEEHYDKCDHSKLYEILKTVLSKSKDHTYVVVIGVYTDIKVKLLLTQLRAFFQIDNLIVSDVLTAAPSLERHLGGLDFAQKVLRVEVVHGLNDLLRILRPDYDKRPHLPKKLSEGSINFRDYQNYYLDKQNLLGYQEGKLLQYVELTKQRARRVYDQTRSNTFLLKYSGFIFMAITLISSILTLGNPSLPAFGATGILGGITILQLITVFFWDPIDRLQKNLDDVVRLQTRLETYSLALALARYHVSRPEWLYHNVLQKITSSKGEQPKLQDQVANVQRQIEMIYDIANKTNQLLRNETLILSSAEDLPNQEEANLKAP